MLAGSGWYVQSMGEGGVRGSSYSLSNSCLSVLIYTFVGNLC